MADHCRDFSRSELLRTAAARAGNGLPAIEPGMPTPAGTGLSRRSFVLRSAGLALSVYGASKLGLADLEAGVASAATTDGRVLLSVFLPGGVDSMSVLAPVGDPLYASMRPNLKLDGASTAAFSEDPRLHWHAAADGLRTLHSENKLTVLPAVGNDHPDQSHFTSRHFWEVGACDTSAGYGWMGRYLDIAGEPGNPLQGLSLDGVLSPAMAASKVPVSAVWAPAGYTLWSPAVGSLADAQLAAVGALGRLPAPDRAFAEARSVAATVDRLRTQLAPLRGTDGTPTWTTPVSYPSGLFGDRLAALAAMVAGDMPLRCVSITAPGNYDTHANQAGSLAANVKLTCDSLLAFQRDLEARGIADRVLTSIWSEFGRRPRENGSGTDHGAAGLGFVMGARASGTMVGEFPGLDRLDAQGNLRATADFRALYASLLEQWLNADAADVIPGAAGLGRPVLVGS
jgi:uncharacterized protein (DUF1501 family)